MKNKHLTFLLAVLMSMAANVVSASDFVVDGIDYNITSPSTVEVTYPSDDMGCPFFGVGYSLISVIIPESVTYEDKTYSVTSIDDYAFTYCSGFTTITIPNSVTSIGEEAFSFCSDLTSVTIPNSVTTIDYAAFRGCSGLTSITIPNSVTSIGNSAFSGCSGLESIVVNSGNTVYDSREGCNAIIETSSNTLIAGCKNTTIPNSVTSIGVEAFWNCEGLTSVTIPNSVTSIGNSAFVSCSGLTSVTIPTSVTSIGERAFDNCSGLTSVTIPNSVTSIGERAFQECSGLETIIVNNGNTVYDSREECNAIIETASHTLIAGCKNTTIPNSVTSIGNYAFSGCSGLISIAIPNSVTSIGGGAFTRCESLTSITIPNSVTSIGDWAFSVCIKLTRINCRATIPPDCGVGCMIGVPEGCTIEVPVGCKSAYEAVSPWNSFYIVETEDPLEATTVTLAAEYGTFCSAKALDFTDVEGVKAYIASVFDTETGELTLTRVKKVKARTGLVLRGTPGQTYEIPEGTGTTVVANLLVGVTEDTELSPTDGNFTNFIMAKNDAGNIGFFRVGGTSTLKGGKAYLQLPSDELSSEVKGFRMMFDDGDMSDNVETIHNEQFTIHNEAGAVYDLQGRRVAKPTKGIYIVNGKKTVIK